MQNSKKRYKFETSKNNYFFIKLIKEQKEDAILTINKWVETIIIGLNLCPFAKTPLQKNEIKFVVADEKNMKSFIEFFVDEILFLEENTTIETTLIIIPAFGNMEQFQTFTRFCEETIQLNEWTSQYQIVSFHPFMRFDGFEHDSPRNLTAMAPFPILHILRTPSVENLGAVLSKDVQIENDKKLQKMTKKEMLALWTKVVS